MASTYQQRATGGTATASAENAPGEAASKAFDQDITSKWLAPSATTPTLTYQFAAAAAYIITSYVLTSANDASGRDPKSWTFKGSHDGSAFTTLDTQTNQSFSTRYTSNVYQFSNTTAYEYYRLDISANNGDSDTQLAELGLFTRDLVSTEITYGGAPNAKDQTNSGNENKDKAFDKNDSTKWLEQKSGGTPFWIQYDFGANTLWQVNSYSFTTANDAEERDPKTWTLTASSTGAFAGEEITVDSVADGALSSSRGATKMFVCGSYPSTAYRYYRFTISDLKNLATASATQLAEIRMYVEIAGGSTKRTLTGVGI